MTINPYEPPAVFVPPPDEADSGRARARQELSGPAISLIIVSILSIGLLAIAIPFDGFILITGLAERIPNRSPGHSVSVAIRLVWDCIIFGASCYVLWGALQMRRLANYCGAKKAAIIACIPCVGPCCLLGIPFGAWAISVLGRSEIAKAFES